MQIMKFKFKLIVAILLFSGILANAVNVEYAKQYRKAWSNNSVSLLKINNKFGEIRINDTGGDSVTVLVIISVDNKSTARGKELADRIQINFQKTGNTVNIETVIEDNFKGNQSFSINYLVNIPKDKDLDITNRYGNLVLNELQAKGKFNVSYGSMMAQKMNCPAGFPFLISINYGKADIGVMNDSKLELNYSKLYSREMNNLQLNSKYSTINVTKLKDLNFISKYDALSIEQSDRIKAESKYTNYKISNLNSSIDLDTSYGSVQIGKVGPKFEKIRISNSYGGINIGMSDLSYKIQADCDYCNIRYPNDRFKGNKSNENHRSSVSGTIGHGGSTVTISSRYGDIKLNE